ncbi:hypothetical protein [Methylocystis heyeri]|uniref:Uncharacterized protein n=1 Tax=Methylocystis heyeri TaxID=391905 RepID=A0A6B8KB18_9HYPH|nr:hypothetical protein [Methylocystis heyeri]QGM45554.1 hypothetical protein H2LOC_007500 [Methylocystis heyeri]
MPESSGRKKFPVALGLGLAALAALLAAFGARIWQFSEPPAVPALLQGLEDSSAAGSQEAFLARLDKRFPKGSSESAMIAALLGEGFKLRKDAHSAEQEAVYERGSSINDRCRRSGSVQWSAENDRLTGVSGGYYLHCQ